MPFIWKVRVLFKTRLIFPRINGPIVRGCCILLFHLLVTILEWFNIHPLSHFFTATTVTCADHKKTLSHLMGKTEKLASERKEMEGSAMI